VVGLIRRRAAEREDLGRRAAEVEIARIVVRHLVVVPRDHEGRRRVRGDQVAIGLVHRVAVPIVDERVDLRAVVLARAIELPAVGAAFVDVVPGVDDEVELLLRDAAVRREVVVLVVAAAAHAKAKPVDGGVGGRRRPRAASPARLVPGAKPIPVLARRLEPRHLHVHAVSELGSRDRFTFLRD
jgi:hypothetical protein